MLQVHLDLVSKFLIVRVAFLQIEVDEENEAMLIKVQMKALLVSVLAALGREGS